MTALNALPDEMLGCFMLVLGVLAKLLCPEAGEFWLALATAFALFFIMHVRSGLSLPNTAKEAPSP